MSTTENKSRAAHSTTDHTSDNKQGSYHTSYRSNQQQQTGKLPHKLQIKPATTNRETTTQATDHTNREVTTQATDQTSNNKQGNYHTSYRSHKQGSYHTSYRSNQQQQTGKLPHKLQITQTGKLPHKLQIKPATTNREATTQNSDHTSNNK